MIELVALVVLVISAAWGVTATPDRRLTWAMYSGSSKAFLWLRGERARWASMDELRLVPEAFYLREADLELLAQEGLPALDGLIVGTRGSLTVACDAIEGLVTTPVQGDEALVLLAAAIRRYECPQP